MILSSPCPKCREPILVGSSRCSRCSYRLVPWETQRALWAFGLKLFVGILCIGVLIYVIEFN